MGLAALAIAWVGGFVFVAFWWIASVIVLWEWQRIVQRDRLIERVGIGALALAVAALFAMHGLRSRRDRDARRRRRGGRLGRRSGGADLGRRRGCLRRILGRQPRPSPREPELRPARDPLAFRRSLGDRHRRLFRRPVDRRPETLAERVAGQDLVGRGGRRVGGRDARPSLFRAGQTGSAGCSGSGLRPRSSPNSAICSNPG